MFVAGMMTWPSSDHTHPVSRCPSSNYCLGIVLDEAVNSLKHWDRWDSRARWRV